MEYLGLLVQSQEINWQTALLRIFVSFIVGTLIGIERETHSQPAGLRTHILISIGATMAMIVSIYIPQVFTDFQEGDPSRIAAQVISGIGFLGAGAIIKYGANVKGLTTAASIWAIAVIGLAVGAGMFFISFAGVAAVLFALTIMNFLEKRIFKERSFRTLKLVIKKRECDIKKLEEALKEQDVKVISTGFETNISEATHTVTFQVGVTKSLNIQRLTDALESMEGMVAFSIETLE